MSVHRSEREAMDEVNRRVAAEIAAWCQWFVRSVSQSITAESIIKERRGDDEPQEHGK